MKQKNAEESNTLRRDNEEMTKRVKGGDTCVLASEGRGPL